MGLLLRKEETGQSITKRDLRNVGYADDYFRVGSNVSTLLEMAVSTQKQIPLGQVFTFGSSTMPNMDSEQERAHLDSCWEERRTMNAMPAESELREFYAHLQELSGTQVNTSADPVVFTAGLPALASLFVALLQKGGSDVLMCSTAYGGSSQLNDLLTSRSSIHRKFTFDVQGDTDICESIQQQLTALASQPESAMPTTVLFLETPTNPDMKVPEFQRVAAMLRDHRDKTGKDVLLLLDTTFAPQAKLMHHLEKEAPDLPVMTFISMSKSISRGKTTAGAVIANHTEQSKSLLSRVVEVAALLDTTAKPDQLQFLTQNHRGVEERNEKAYAVAAAMGDTLCSAVQESCE